MKSRYDRETDALYVRAAAVHRTSRVMTHETWHTSDHKEPWIERGSALPFGRGGLSRRLGSSR